MTLLRFGALDPVLAVAGQVLRVIELSQAHPGSFVTSSGTIDAVARRGA
ncbi:MAG: hypothetical protein ACRDV3_03870 [Acidothermaceae bacterium]